MRMLFLTIVWTALLGGTVTAAERLPLASPGDVGLDPAKLTQIDALVETGLQEKRMPGCVVLVGRHGKIAWLKAYGQRAVRPEMVPMTTLNGIPALDTPWSHHMPGANALEITAMKMTVTVRIATIW